MFRSVTYTTRVTGAGALVLVTLLVLLLTSPGRAAIPSQQGTPTPISPATPAVVVTPSAATPGVTSTVALPTQPTPRTPTVATPPATAGTAEPPLPAGTGTPDAGPSPTLPAGGSRTEVTVAAISGTDITIYNAQGALQTITVTESVPVVRDAQPSNLQAIEATDRIVITRDARGRVVSILAISVQPTPAPSPTVALLPTTTVVPQPSQTADPAATGTPGAGPITGIITAVSNGNLTIQADDGTSQLVDLSTAPGVVVLRDGEPAGVADIRTDDDVSITRSASGVPTRVEITSGAVEPEASQFDWRYVLFPLLLLVPFLLLLLPLLRRRAGRPFIVTRRGQ